MSETELLQIAGRTLTLQSATKDPDFTYRSVLAGDPWDYVALQLKGEDEDDALFYWEQSKQFLEASADLPITSSPLTSYYSVLNASKALLTVKGKSFNEQHGVTGDSLPGTRTALRNEYSKFHPNGVLPALCGYLGDPYPTGSKRWLHDLLYHLPFLHRAFVLTYSSETELFLPLSKPAFVLEPSTRNVFFQAELRDKYDNPSLSRVLPNGFTYTRAEDGPTKLRFTHGFNWKGRKNAKDQTANLRKLKQMHGSLRKVIKPIISASNSWYLKKDIAAASTVNISILPTIFVALHRLSELSRYNPVKLNKHLECHHNWLLSEFVNIAPEQFILRVASEITGREFIEPFAARVKS